MALNRFRIITIMCIFRVSFSLYMYSTAQSSLNENLTPVQVNAFSFFVLYV